MSEFNSAIFKQLNFFAICKKWWNEVNRIEEEKSVVLLKL